MKFNLGDYDLGDFSLGDLDPNLPRLFALPTKLSRSEIQNFVLSYIQYFKE